MAGETAYIRHAVNLRRRKGVMVETRDGFDLFINGEWHERFRLKRDAIFAAESRGVTRIEFERFAI